MNDELVCARCGPLEGAPESEWPDQSGPPWHPNCRCSSSIRFETPEQLAEQFGARQAEREAWLRERGLWKEPAEPVTPEATISDLVQRAIDRGIAKRIQLTYQDVDRNIEPLDQQYHRQAIEEFVSSWNQMLGQCPRLERSALGEFRTYHNMLRDYDGLAYKRRALSDNIVEINQLTFWSKTGEPSIYEQRFGTKLHYGRTVSDVMRHELGHALYEDWVLEMKEMGDFAYQTRVLAAHQAQSPTFWVEQLGEIPSEDVREWIADAFCAWTDSQMRASLPDDTIALLREIAR